MPIDPEKIRPPFSKAERERIREILEKAQIEPSRHFSIPQKADPKQPGRFEDPNPDLPFGRIKENYNGQKGNGTFTDLDFGWQPGCEEPFAIVLSEVWNPPPQNLAGKFQLWAEFATVRAILICLRNDRCRLVHPLGCKSAWDLRLPNGKHYGRARFVFQCIEII